MFKRRDWAHLKGKDGADGGGSSDSDDDRSDDEARPAAFHESEGSEEAEDEAGASGDEEGSSQEGDDLSADDIIRVWTSADPEVNKFKGIPLRCVPCKALLLNRTTYLAHVAAKGHCQKMKHAGSAASDAIQLATESTAADQEEAETHMERLERLRLLVAGPSGPKDKKKGGKGLPPRAAADSDDDGDDDSSSDEEDGGPAARALRRRQGKVAASAAGRAAGQEGDQAEQSDAVVAKPDASSQGDKAKKAHEDRKRPGKRQRALLKAEGKDPSTGRVFKAKKKRGGAAPPASEKKADAPLPLAGTLQQPVVGETPERAGRGRRQGTSKSAAKPGRQDRPGKEAAGGHKPDADGQKRRRSIA